MSIFRRRPHIPGPYRAVGEVIPGLYQRSLGSTSVFIVAMTANADAGGDAPDVARPQDALAGITPPEVALRETTLPEIALIDAGWRTHSGMILKTLRQLGYGPGSIRRLIATHYHPDHIGGMARMQAASGAAVASHRAEAGRLQQARRNDIPNPVQQWWLKGPLWPLLALLHPPPIAQVTELEEGDAIPLLSGARVVHTPGHTPGSISLHFPDEGALIVGDALQRRGNRLTLPSRFFSSDMAAAKASVRKLAELDFEVLCLSHFQPMRQGARAALRSLAEYVS